VAAFLLQLGFQEVWQRGLSSQPKLAAANWAGQDRASNTDHPDRRRRASQARPKLSLPNGFRPKPWSIHAAKVIRLAAADPEGPRLGGMTRSDGSVPPEHVGAYANLWRPLEMFRENSKSDPHFLLPRQRNV
jgi:hypothetical protein